MKKCPQCTRIYSDDTLNYCLDDGTVLIKAETASTQENIPRLTEQQTEILPNEIVSDSIPKQKISLQQTNENLNENATVVASSNVREVSNTQSSKQGVSPIFAYLTVGLLALLVLFSSVGLFVWMNSNAKEDSNSHTEIAQNLTDDENKMTAENGNDSKDINNNLELNDVNLNSTKTQTPDTKPSTEQKPTATANKTATPENTTTPKPTETATTTPTPDKPSGKYFVIMGSFPPNQADQANQRLNRARNAGLNARIINTSKFSKLKGGYLSVVAGPYSKDEAKNALSTARSVSGDAYIKAGF